MGRKRARRTPKPIVAETKPGRRWKFSLKISDNILVKMMNIESIVKKNSYWLRKLYLPRKSIFDPSGSLGVGARMSIDLDTGVVTLPLTFGFVFRNDFQKSLSSSFFLETFWSPLGWFEVFLARFSLTTMDKVVDFSRKVRDWLLLFFWCIFHKNQTCESRPNETTSPAASSSKRSVGNKRKRRVSTGPVSGAWSFGHWTFIYPLPFPSIDYKNIHLLYVYYMLSFHHQSQWDYKS